MTAGEIIRAKRKECGLTLEEVGNKIGYQKSGISKIEKDDRMPRREALTKLSHLLNFTECEYLQLLLAYAPFDGVPK